ncbi:MAG: S8/S53 family peptidase [Bacteroidales bacterium]|nr:S8/S53 family peptidase [Bacteroidales bacterium]
MADLTNTPPCLSIKGLTSLINPNIFTLIMIVFGIFGFLTPVNGQNESQLVPAKPSAPVFYDTIAGKPVQKSVLLMWIDTGFVNPVTINDTSNTIRPFSDFVTQAYMDSIPIVLLKDFAHAEAKKIFHHRTEDDTISISRTGKRVIIPPFYTALWVRFNDPVSDIEEIHDTLYADHDILYSIEYNVPFDYMFNVNDPKYCSNQLSLHSDSVCQNSGGYYNIDMPRAWNLTKGEKFVRVGIHDSGINWEHPDFIFHDGTHKISEGCNYVDGSACHDYLGHGTMMAGIIGAITNNDIGVAGIAGGEGKGTWGASIIDMTLGDSAFVSRFAASVEDGATSANISYGQGLHIMNFSLGWKNDLLMYYPFEFNLLKSCIQYAYKNEVTMVCASGNLDSPHDTIMYPACFRDDWVMNVGGANNQTSLSAYGATSHLIDLIAPGGTPSAPFAYTTRADGQYTYVAETSTAAAHTSGVAALIMSFYNDSVPNLRNLSPEDAEHIIEMGTSDNYGWANSIYDIYALGYHYETNGVKYIGWGRLNAFYSIKHIDTSLVYFRHIDTTLVLSTSLFGAVQNLSTINPSESFNGYYTSSHFSTATAYPVETVFNLQPPSNVEIDTVWVRNSSSNLWGQPHQSASGWQFTPEDSVMLTYFDGFTAKTTGYVYLIGNYAPLSIGDTIHIGLSVYGHYTDTEGFIETENATDFSVFPNPASNDVTVVLQQPDSAAEIRISDINGRIFSRIQLSGGLQTILINTNEYPGGLYLIQYINRNTTLTKKLIVSH